MTQKHIERRPDGSRWVRHPDGVEFIATLYECALYDALHDVDSILSGWRRGLASGQHIALEDVVKLRRYVQDALGWSDTDSR